MINLYVFSDIITLLFNYLFVIYVFIVNIIDSFFFFIVSLSPTYHPNPALPRDQEGYMWVGFEGWSCLYLD